MENLRVELNAYLSQFEITSENIGDIRRDCMVPWYSEWNSYVRDVIAAREMAQKVVDSRSKDV